MLVHKSLGIIALAITCLCITTAQATPTDRIIIKVSESMRPAVLADGGPAPRARERLVTLSTVAGRDVAWQRSMSGGADVLRLPGPLPLETVRTIAEVMALLPGVEYAEPDVRVFPLVEPNDPLYGSQWYLDEVSSVPGNLNYGIDAVGAWGFTTGDAVTVAVVDTGVRFTHVDLIGKVLPGHDFVDEDLAGLFSPPTTATAVTPMPRTPATGSLPPRPMP
jgi:serine protease